MISRSNSGDGDPYPSDGVAILIDGSRWFYYGLASDSGDNTYWRDIDGTLSWDAIKDMEDNALEQMEKQGKRTGRCAGKVTATYNPGSIRYFTTAAKNASGDSGGVHFHIDNTGDTLVSGIHKGDANGDAMAPFIKDQYDELGLTFF